MRATLIYGAGDVRVEHVPDPKLADPGDAIVRVVRACVCGSDLHPYRDMPATEHGRPIGHEFLGVIEEIGSDVAGLASGDLVLSPFVWADNTCDFCRRACRPRVGTAASTATTRSAAGRPTRSGFRRPRAPW
jgi:threonine dehydrogenase-like Zn-dependent dehydrogenase